MVVIDSTQECINALQFAGLRAKRTGAGIVMLYVIEPDQFQHWVGVAEAIHEEQHNEAVKKLELLVREIETLCGITPEYVIRNGIRVHQVRKLIGEDTQISILVLGAGNSKKGPGPLVTQLAFENSNTLSIPITIIPQSMSFEDLQIVC